MPYCRNGLAIHARSSARQLKPGKTSLSEISYTGFTTQKQIADILSAYDDLIENNRRRIQLLEQSARLLYKEWFVRLRFPGHEHVKIKNGVPEGWEKDINVFSYI